jgi:hypothetical protein
MGRFGYMASEPHSSTLVLRDLEYIGTHPNAGKELNKVDVAFEDDGVSISRKGARLGVIAWPDVENLSAFSERVPGTVGIPSVLFFGVFAFLFKRRGQRLLLRVEDQQGDWLFDVRGIDLDDLRSGLSDIRQRRGI